MDFRDQIELVREYIEDAYQFLDLFEGLLLQIENEQEETSPETIIEIQGVLHTFKGNSGMMGFSQIQKYAHSLEDVFKEIQGGALDPDRDVIDFFLEAVTALRTTIENMDPQNPQDIIEEQYWNRIETFQKGENKQPQQDRTQSVSETASAVKSPAADRISMKVDPERLDELLRAMGEMVITKNRLQEMSAKIIEKHGEKNEFVSLAEITERIERISESLHDSIINVRMVPVRQVFKRFPRMVRDLAREKGKEVSLLFQGEDTELDKSVIEAMSEPLLHIIRNAVDHGIEPPHEREAQGKPRQGTVMVSASQVSGSIIVEVEDDGRGIATDKLLKKARETGVALPENPDGHALLDLIFMPGFSTSDKVSEISGRGVGMDVVRKSITGINGSVDVETEAGLGTRFTVRLPLTLAIISALMVEVAGNQYALPLAYVTGSAKLSKEDIYVVDQKKTARIKDRYLPLVSMDEFFGLRGGGNGKDRYVVMVEGNGNEAGFVVDDLVGRQEIVIKGLDRYLGETPGISGATIKGDGKVVLILDVIGAMEKAGPRRVPQVRQSGAEGGPS